MRLIVLSSASFDGSDIEFNLVTIISDISDISEHGGPTATEVRMCA